MNEKIEQEFTEYCSTCSESKYYATKKCDVCKKAYLAGRKTNLDKISEAYCLIRLYGQWELDKVKTILKGLIDE